MIIHTKFIKRAFGEFKGDRNPNMTSMFKRQSSINHGFLYQFHQNRLKNREVVGVWIFANGL